MGKVHFYYADRKLNISQKRQLKIFIEKIFKKERKSLQKINYVFCSDSYLLEINRSFLSHDYFTDTITFHLNEHGQEIFGEVYISIDRIKENAIYFAVLFKDEINRVIFHSALHLCGYKDKKKSEKMLMHKKEDYYLHLFKKGST